MVGPQIERRNGVGDATAGGGGRRRVNMGTARSHDVLSQLPVGRDAAGIRRPLISIDHYRFQSTRSSADEIH